MTSSDGSKLPDVEQIHPLVKRILGQNPGDYTLQGTNTYLIGSPGTRAILLDTGEGKLSYIPLLRDALRDYTGIEKIILSHHHLDHVLGIGGVLKLLKELAVDGTYQPPSIHKFPCETHDSQTVKILQELDQDLFKKTNKGEVIHSLRDGESIPVPTQGGSSILKILQTSGHTEDSACFVLTSDKSESVLFTADTVLGQGTSVFTDLKALIDSLQYCIEEMQKTKQNKIPLFCGHGPVVQDGIEKCQEYIDHRLEREHQVVQILKEVDKPISAADLVKLIYGPDLPSKVVPAAERGLVLHLEKLEQEKSVKRSSREGEILWELIRE